MLNEVEFVGNNKEFNQKQPRHYIRVPKNTDPQLILYFVENVWKIPRPGQNC